MRRPTWRRRARWRPRTLVSWHSCISATGIDFYYLLKNPPPTEINKTNLSFKGIRRVICLFFFGGVLKQRVDNYYLLTNPPKKHEHNLPSQGNVGIVFFIFVFFFFLGGGFLKQ